MYARIIPRDHSPQAAGFAVVRQVASRDGGHRIMLHGFHLDPRNDFDKDLRETFCCALIGFGAAWNWLARSTMLPCKTNGYAIRAHQATYGSMLRRHNSNFEFFKSVFWSYRSGRRLVARRGSTCTGKTYSLEAWNAGLQL